jgi:hypothetical protein
MSNIGFNYWATTAAISGGVCAMSITTQWPLAATANGIVCVGTALLAVRAAISELTDRKGPAKPSVEAPDANFASPRL